MIIIYNVVYNLIFHTICNKNIFSDTGLLAFSSQIQQAPLTCKIYELALLTSLDLKPEAVLLSKNSPFTFETAISIFTKSGWMTNIIFFAFVDIGTRLSLFIPSPTNSTITFNFIDLETA